MTITRDIAAKVLRIVDAGLSNGLGIAQPGKMCVEAAVCYALGEPHGDEPSCVAPTLRSLKIRLNDARWSSDRARARGLRRLALIQLGSKGALDEKEFARRVVDYALRVSIPAALRTAASVCKSKDHTSKLIAAAARCESEGTPDAATAAANAAAYATAAANAAAYAANAAAYAATDAATAAANAAYAAAYAAYAATAANAAADANKSLAEYAEAVVQILIEMKVPGCQWLDLAPLEVAS